VLEVSTVRSKNTEDWLPIRSILNGAIQLDDGMQVTGVKVYLLWIMIVKETLYII